MLLLWKPPAPPGDAPLPFAVGVVPQNVNTPGGEQVLDGETAADYIAAVAQSAYGRLAARLTADVHIGC